MGVYKQPKSKYWWYKFTWSGEQVRKSTKQTNKRIAEQMEAAHRTALAKGEVGIREKKSVPSLRGFADRDFLPFVRSTFAIKPKTLSYYENGVARLLAFERIASEKLDSITTDRIAEYVSKRRAAKGKRGHALQTASLNRELQVLRRMFRLAEEWGRVERTLPTVKMLPGEKRRERVLSATEEMFYFRGAASETMQRYSDPMLLGNVATILLDCGLRPEECFRLRTENVVAGHLEIHHGKTENARRRILMTERVNAIIEKQMSKSDGSGWIFPAQTKSGHIEPSTLKKAHRTAIAEATQIMQKETGNVAAQFAPFELYTLRHTCLTRWAPHMDPFTLAHLAGHRDMNITKRYVHPEEGTVRIALEKVQKAKSGHTSGHTAIIADLGALAVSTATV